MTLSRPDSMNCDVALERLDAVWIDPLPDEPLDADLSAAWEHVQQCSVCWAKFEQRRDSDARLAKVMQAVPIPIGLREQLLARLAEMPAAASDNDSLVPHSNNDPIVVDDLKIKAVVARPASTVHRRVWAITTAAALLFVAAGGSWMWFVTQSRLVSVHTLCEVTPLEPAGLSVVNDLKELPALPQSWLRMKGLKIVGAPCWFQPPGSKRVAAWIPFELRLPKSKPIQGVLLATLRDNVLDPPAELMVKSTFLSYTHHADGKPLSISGWSERGVVYLCFVNGEPASLERLMKLTEPTAA